MDIHDELQAGLNTPSPDKEFRVIHLSNNDVMMVTRIESEARGFHSRMLDKDKYKVETLFLHEDQGDPGDEHVEREEIKFEGGDMDVEFGENE